MDDLGALCDMLESWELSIPCHKAAQITDLRTVLTAKVFARHQHRNAGRIRHHAVRRCTLCNPLDRNMLHLVCDDAPVSFPWGEIRRRQGFKCFVQKLAGAMLSKIFKHLITKVTQADVAVSFWVLCG